MAAHILAVRDRIIGHDLVVVIGCDVCGWSGAMGFGYEKLVLASTAECPGTSDLATAVQALIARMEAAQEVTITLWDNCFSWQEAVCGPLPSFREKSDLPPDAPPDLPPVPVEVIRPIVAIKLDERGSWTVWTEENIYYSHHSWRNYVPIQPPVTAFRHA